MRTRHVIVTLCVFAMSTAWSGHAASATSKVTGSIDIATASTPMTSRP